MTISAVKHSALETDLLDSSWLERIIGECLVSRSHGHRGSIPQSEYLQEGSYPIVDQGEGLIAGWTDDEDSVISDGLPIIVFGDHTRRVKFVDFPFAVGADGTKLLLPDPAALDPLFFYFAILNLDIPARGYNRHYRLLRESVIAFPQNRQEQRAIASVLRSVQEAIQTRQRELEFERERKAALMQHLFTKGTRGKSTKQTEIGEMPENWDVKRCMEVCDSLSVGIVVRPSTYYEASGVPAFRSLNVREDRLVTNDLVFISPQANDTKLVKSKLRAGDVLIVRTGEPGTSCVVPDEFDGSNCIDIIFARPDGAVMTSGFLSRFMNSAGAKGQTLKARVGLAQQHLNLGAVQRMFVPVPTLQEQLDIVEPLEACDSKISWLEKEAAVLNELFRALLDMFMTGRLSAVSLIEPLEQSDDKHRTEVGA